MRIKLWLVGLVLLIGAVEGWAQTIVINPTTVVFVASPDHDVVYSVTAADFSAEISVVERYELRIFLPGATAPIVSVNLAKPQPDSNREIRATPSELLGIPLGTFVARVAAIGPAGEGVSDPTLPFVRLAAPAPPTAVRLSSLP